MNCKKHFLLFLLVCFAGCVLGFTSLAAAAISTGDANYDNTIQTKLDWLMKEVASKEIQIDTEFQEESNFNSILNIGVQNVGTIRELYTLAMDLAKQAALSPDDIELQEKARLALDQFLLSVLYDVIEQKALRPAHEEIAQMMIDILEGKETVEAFSEETFLLGEIPESFDDDERKPDDDPEDTEPEGWLFYGRAYDLDTDVILSDDGTLSFVDDETTDDVPAIAPYLALSGSSTSEAGGTARYTAGRSAANEDFYRYTWDKSTGEGTDGETEPDPAFSTTLYKNYWISVVYEDPQNDGSETDGEIVAGLTPGDGSTGHPGEGYPRDEVEIDISEQTGESLPGDEYLTIYEQFESKEDFDLEDKFVIYVPDASEGFDQPDQGIGHKYKVVTGTATMVVDRSRHNYDESNFEDVSSLDQGIISVAEDEVDLENEDFTSSDDFALQTVGNYGMYNNGLYTPDSDQEDIQQSNLLAYLVQVEEDIVNEKIMEMSQDDTLRDMVDGLRSYARIRARDAMFVEKADAQAGRVMKDAHGNWVRVQQYVLRPDSNTVQFLNVSLRDASAGNISGMSTIDFTTTFRDSIDGAIIRNLPWGNYLNTQTTSSDRKYVYSDYYSPQLDNMYVKFTNPGNETVQESRSFYERGVESYNQYVSSETLSLLNGDTLVDSYTNTFGETVRYEYTSHFVTNPEISGYYGMMPAVDDTGAPIEGRYRRDRSHKILDVALYRVSDTNGHPGSGDNTDTSDIFAADDIWAVLGAGEYSGSLADFDSTSSIEIVMGSSEGTSFQLANNIDTIFIPMSHMLWVEGGETQYAER